MRWSRTATLALLLLGAPASTSAQASTEFRTLALWAPRLSAEIVTPSTMGSPAGQYRIVGGPQEHTFQIDRCTEGASDGELVQYPGHEHSRCRGIEISRMLDCDGCSPHAVTFESVVFARYRSPSSDRWYAHLRIGLRQVRLVIEVDRFIYQGGGVDGPSIEIIEAPIRRLRDR